MEASGGRNGRSKRGMIGGDEIKPDGRKLREQDDSTAWMLLLLLLLSSTEPYLSAIRASFSASMSVIHECHGESSLQVVFYL